MSIIGFPCAEQSVKRVVSWDDKAGNVHEEFTRDVEEDKEEVDPEKTKENIDFRNGSLFLKVVERRILGKLAHSLVSTVLLN